MNPSIEFDTRLKTKRLTIEPLSVNESSFICELVNTEGWIRFIGNRNIQSDVDATAYIKRIQENANVQYWTVRLRETNDAIGVITFIKRDYLDYRDLGFAFLPVYGNKGYAFEAATAVLQHVVHLVQAPNVLATTMPVNTGSIKLLTKLGFRFSNEILVEGETLHVYSVSSDEVLINEMAAFFFDAFSNKGRQANIDILNGLCLPQAQIINTNGSRIDCFDLQTFIRSRAKILTAGTLTDFEEKEVSSETSIRSNLAFRVSVYQKRGRRNGELFSQKGCKMFQFIKQNEKWKISSVTWEDDV